MVDAVAEDKATPAGTMPTTESPTPAASTEARAAEAADQAAKDKAIADGTAPAVTLEGTTSAEKPAAPIVPEKYELKVPDGSLLDTGATERIAATARELGLSNEAAQKTVDLLDGEIAATVAAVLEANQPGGAEWLKQEEAWKAETLADPQLGKTPDERKAAIDKGRAVLKRFADTKPEDAEAFKDFLEGTGLGSSPKVARFFAWLGKAMDEGKVITAPPGEGKKTAAEILYPNEAAQRS